MKGLGRNRFVVTSSDSLDSERLELSIRRAAERQSILAQGSVDYLVVQSANRATENGDPDLVVAVLAETVDPGRSSSLVVRLIRCGIGKDVLAVLADRTVVDPLSLVLFISDVKVLYEAAHESFLPPLEMQFDEYQHWREEHLSTESAIRQVAFWQTALAKPLPPLELFPDFSSCKAQESCQGGRLRQMGMCQVPLSQAQCDAILRTSTATSTLPRVIVLAVFHLLLARYTGGSDIIVGCHVSGRGPSVEIKGLMGAFENWVAVRIQSADSPSVQTFIKRVGDALVDAESNADIPLSKLRRELGLEGGEIFKAGFEVYGSPVEELSFPIIASRLLRVVLGLSNPLGREHLCVEDFVTLGKNNSDAEGRPFALPAEARAAALRSQMQRTTASSLSSTTAETGNARGDSLEAALQDAVEGGDDLPSAVSRTKPLSLGGVELSLLHLPVSMDDGEDDIRLVGVVSPVLRLAIEYDTSKFSKNTIQRMSTHFSVLLDSVLLEYKDVVPNSMVVGGSGAGLVPSHAADPGPGGEAKESNTGSEQKGASGEQVAPSGPLPATSLSRRQRISELRMLEPDEERLVTELFNNTRLQLPSETRDLCIHNLVELQAKRTPLAQAISLNGGRTFLTYEQLDRKANQLANFLRLLGVRREAPVAVFMRRSPELVVAWLELFTCCPAGDAFLSLA